MRSKLSAAVSLLALLVGACAILLVGDDVSAPRLPHLIVWAWERPEDLRPAPADVGVAFLARTVYLRGTKVFDRPRLQPLRFRPGTSLIPVVRIESDAGDPPALTAGQRDAVVQAILLSAEMPSIAAVQVDFDATVSQRAFYGGVLRALRARLPRSIPLSMTALASWCLGDPWITSLPIDEAVPMLFQMGPDRRIVLDHLAAGGDFTARVCRSSVGLSTDEPVAQYPRGRRVYLFHPRAWPASALTALAKETTP